VLLQPLLVALCASSSRKIKMDLDEDKIDEAVLALLYLTLHDEQRAWKGMDFEVMNRLHEKGYIDNPINKTKSVWLTDEGLNKSKLLFAKLFSK
jgi:hypothetical protein